MLYYTLFLCTFITLVVIWIHILNAIPLLLVTPTENKKLIKNVRRDVSKFSINLI